MNHQQGLASGLSGVVALPLVQPAQVLPPPAIEANHYLYKSMELTGPQVYSARRNAGSIVSMLDAEVRAIARSFRDTIEHYHRNQWRDAVLSPSRATDFLQDPKLERFIEDIGPEPWGLLPRAAGWICHDGATFYRMQDKDAYQAIFYIYGRLKPECRGLTPQSVEELVLSCNQQLVSGLPLGLR